MQTNIFSSGNIGKSIRLERIFNRVTGCPVPVVVAGGQKMDTQHDLLEMVYDSIHSGGKGVAIGRNVFQADDPTALIVKISKIVHQRLTVDEV
ncbi:MAG: hypothetical protein KAJ93_07670 [Methanosarcinales archaeon]|nr:hypothetical protein [Methanosarcinales archaeon]